MKNYGLRLEVFEYPQSEEYQELPVYTNLIEVTNLFTNLERLAQEADEAITEYEATTCPHESWEVVDNTQTVEYWGSPRKIGDKIIYCTACGQDITQVLERRYVD